MGSNEHFPTTGRAVIKRALFVQTCGVAINIEATPEQIWSLLTNVDKIPRWTSSIETMQGTIAPGEKVRLTVPYAPGRTFKLRVKEVVPEERMIWTDGMLPMFRGIRTYQLVPQTNGSTTFSMVERLSGIMLPMIAGSLPDFGLPFEQFAADLKQTAEEGNRQTSINV